MAVAQIGICTNVMEQGEPSLSGIFEKTLSHKSAVGGIRTHGLQISQTKAPRNVLKPYESGALTN